MKTGTPVDHGTPFSTQSLSASVVDGTKGRWGAAVVVHGTNPYNPFVYSLGHIGSRGIARCDRTLWNARGQDRHHWHRGPRRGPDSPERSKKCGRAVWLTAAGGPPGQAEVSAPLDFGCKRSRKCGKVAPPGSVPRTTGTELWRQGDRSTAIPDPGRPFCSMNYD